MKSRPKDSKSLFHSSEFTRLEQKLGTDRGSLLAWFRRIDQKKKGSFGYNEIIQDYIRNGNSDAAFAFEIMGRKIVASGDKPEDIVGQYNRNDDHITATQFNKFTDKEFDLKETESKKLWNVLIGNNNESKIKVEKLIEAMRLQGSQRRIVYIKPTLWDTYKRDFFK